MENISHHHNDNATNNYYLELYVTNYNMLVQKMEEREDILFDICEKAPIYINDNCKIFYDPNKRSFDDHKLIRNCFYGRHLYNSCITFTKTGYHLCGRFPIMILSDLDLRLLKKFNITPYSSIYILKGCFYSGTTAYRIPLLLSNNREIPHAYGGVDQLFYYYQKTGESLRITCNADNNLVYRTHTGVDYENDLSVYTNETVMGGVESASRFFQMQPKLVSSVIRELSSCNQNIDHFSNKIIVDHTNLLFKYVMTMKSIVMSLADENLTAIRRKNAHTRLSQLEKILTAGDWFKFISKRNPYSGHYPMSERNSRSNRESQITNPAFYANVLRSEPYSHSCENTTKTRAIPEDTALFFDLIYARSSIGSFMREYSLACNIHIINVNDVPINWPFVLNYLMCARIAVENVAADAADDVKRIVIQSFHPTRLFVRGQKNFNRMYNLLKLEWKLKCEIIETTNYIYISTHQSQPGKMIDGVFLPISEIVAYNPQIYAQYKYLFGPHSSFLNYYDIEQYSPIERFSIATNYLATSVGINTSDNIKSTIISDTLVQNVFYQLQPSEFTHTFENDPRGGSAGILNYKTLYVNDPRISLDGYMMPKSIANAQMVDYHYRYRFSFTTRSNKLHIVTKPLVKLHLWDNCLFAILFNIKTLSYPISYFSNGSLKIVETIQGGGVGGDVIGKVPVYEYAISIYIYDVELIDMYKQCPERFKLTIDYSQNQVGQKKSWFVDSHLRLDQPFQTGSKVTDIIGQKGLFNVMNDDAFKYGGNYDVYAPLTSLIARSAFATLRNTRLSADKNVGRTSFIPVYNYSAGFFKSGKTKLCNYTANALANSNVYLTTKYFYQMSHGSEELLPGQNHTILSDYILSKIDFVINKDNEISSVMYPQNNKKKANGDNNNNCADIYAMLSNVVDLKKNKPKRRKLSDATTDMGGSDCGSIVSGGGGGGSRRCRTKK